MKVEMGMGTCTVTRETSDPKYYSESRLLYHVKLALIAQGYDVIKKRMWRDGHMVDDTCQYIRDRKGAFAVWDDQYALRFTYEDFNKGSVVYNVAN